MLQLHIRLLGEFSLAYGDAPLTTINTSRLQILLAYLVLHRDAPQSRQHLAFLLGLDSSEAQARTNLRHQFHLLRQALPEADRFLQSDAHTLPWRSETPFRLDVADFESATIPSVSLMALQEAIEEVKYFRDWSVLAPLIFVLAALLTLALLWLIYTLTERLLEDARMWRVDVLVRAAV